MIVTLTPNPSVDETLWLDHVRPGKVNRVALSHLDPAGKGINAARMAFRLCGATLAFGFVGGETGLIIERALNEEGVPHSFVHVPGQTRINTTVVEKSQATSYYGPGPEVTTTHLDALERMVLPWLQQGAVLVLAGSLPVGVPSDFYARYVRAARRRGALIILDAEGDALAQGLAEKPDLIKPNRREAEQLLGHRLEDDGDVVAGARELMERGAGAVVVSLADRGAIGVRGARAWTARPPKVERLSSVGSGDSMVAGFAVELGRGREFDAGLRLGTAAGAATAASRGTSLGTREAVEELIARVQVQELEWADANVDASGEPGALQPHQ